MDLSKYFSIGKPVYFSECGSNLNIHLSALMKAVEHAGTAQFSSVGYGTLKLRAMGIAFFLNRFHIRIVRMPKAEETITIHTWPRTPKGPLFFRDFRIVSSAETLIDIVSGWAALDINAHKIIHPKQISLEIETESEFSAFDDAFPRIQLPEFLEQRFIHTVMPSDLDLNCHVNNAKYFDFIEDCLSADEYSRLKELQVFYKREVKIGEEIAIYRTDTEDRIYIIGRSDATVNFETALLLNPIGT